MSSPQEIFLVHVSDLHIGSFSGSTGVAVNPFVRHHHFDLAAGLTRTVDILVAMASKRPGSTLRFVVSGDLTATGAAEEFANAQTFLGSRWLTCFDHSIRAGLMLDPGVHQTVPGNHDHWGGLRGFDDLGGLRPLGSRLPDPIQFRPTPWCENWTSPDGSLALELFGIDTNSGVTGRNYLATGRVHPEEADALEAMLKASVHQPGVKKRVRALLLHHSPSHAGRSNTLDRASASRLIGLCSKHGVSAMLCGDVHTFRSTALAPHPTPVYELRSPSSIKGPADRVDAGFLFHRVSVSANGRARWQTYLYRWAAPGPSFGLPASSAGKPVSDFTCS